MSNFNYFFDARNAQTDDAAQAAQVVQDAPQDAPHDAPHDAPQDAPHDAPQDALRAGKAAAEPADPWKAAGYTEGDESRCTQCKREFNSRRGLLTHITSRNSTCLGAAAPPAAPPRPRSCRWCGTHVDSDKSLRIHINLSSDCNRSELSARGSQPWIRKAPPADPALAKIADEAAREACVRRLDAVRAHTAASAARQKVAAAVEALAAAERAAESAERQSKSLADAADEAAAAAKLARETVAEYELGRVPQPRPTAW